MADNLGMPAVTLAYDVRQAAASARRLVESLRASGVLACPGHDVSATLDRALQEAEALARHLNPSAETGAPVRGNDGPYRPELAQAFREGARELLASIQTADNDRVAVDADALIEESEGGVIVHCTVFISDGERPLMPGEGDEGAGGPPSSVESEAAALRARQDVETVDILPDGRFSTQDDVGDVFEGNYAETLAWLEAGLDPADCTPPAPDAERPYPDIFGSDRDNRAAFGPEWDRNR